MWYIHTVKLLQNYYKRENERKGALFLKRQILPFILSASLAVFLLTGCGSGSSDELSAYQASMNTFCDNISYINDQINALDGSGESDVETLLNNLDTLDDQFS